jgi:thiamine-monophosphate kinase
LRLSEKDIIAKIQHLFAGGGLLIDDCGIIPDPGQGKLLLATSDLMESGRHFCLEWHPPKMLGRKLLMANLSDLDSSGAIPTCFMLSLSVGGDIEAEMLEQLLIGLSDAAREHNITIVGGDTVGRQSGLGLGIAAFGVANRRLSRNGVQVGDTIYVDSLPGASHRGLHKLQSGQRWDPKFPDADLRAHLDPSPNIGLGAILAEISQVHACIDLSDGLSKDLRMLAEASRVSIVVNQGLSDDSLYGGEDYSRCFASSLNISELQELTGRNFFPLGTAIQMADDLLLCYTEGGIRPLEDRSFAHMPGTD